MKNYLFLTCCILIFFACKKGDNGGSNPPNPPDPSAPTISSINPTSGHRADTISISGNNFGTDLSKVKVYFNGMQATVTSVNNTQANAIVPKGAGTGKVSISVSGLNVDGPTLTYVLSYTVTTIAGNGTIGFVDGAASSAEFKDPAGIAIDAQGNIYVADVQNNCIRKISAGSSPVVSTFAGSSTGASGVTDGTGTNARFGYPSGLCIDASGNFIVSDVPGAADIIRNMTSAGVVTTLTGLAGGLGSGYADGPLASARFYSPTSVALDVQGNIYVADADNNCIRKISTTGTVSTLAGSTTAGYIDGTGSAARFSTPFGIAVDLQGNVFVADCNNHSIRKITPGGVVSTFGGGGPSKQGSTDGDISVALFMTPRSLATDAQGNLYVAETAVYPSNVGHRIRKITKDGIVSTIAGSDQGYIDGDGKTAKFYYPNGITLDINGNIYVSDANNYRIRKITQE